MHDLDRTQAEYAAEFAQNFDELGNESGEMSDFEADDPSREDEVAEILDELGMVDELDPESDSLGAEASWDEVVDEYPQEEGENDAAYESDGVAYAESDSYESTSDQEEIDLAMELLAVEGEGELDQFLGKLIKRGWRGLRRIAPGILKPVGGVLRGVVRKALPLAGRALGMAFGGPAGAALAGRLAPSAGRLLGLELDGLSNEDTELAVARRMVRLGTDVARRAAMTPPGTRPAAAVRRALVDAARTHAPGLVGRSGRPGAGRGRKRRGTWYRKGNRLIIVGA